MAKKVMMTGERGQLATYLRKYIELDGKDLAFPVENVPNIADPLLARVRRICSSYQVEEELDITDHNFPDVVKVLKPDIIIHFGAVVGTDKCEATPERCQEVNFNGTLNVIEAARLCGATLIYISTTAIYDPEAEKPYTEESHINPHTIYGQTKYNAERMVTSQKFVPWIVLRPCFIFGGAPLDHSSILTKIAVQHFMNKGNNDNSKKIKVLLNPALVKDYMRVEDFTEAVMSLFNCGDTLHGKILNVAGMKAKPLFVVLSSLAQHLGISYEELPIDLHPEKDYLGNHVVNAAPFMLMTGWYPRINPTDAGMKRLVQAADQYVENISNGGHHVY